MSAYGPPRACRCGRGHATLLCADRYDDWHGEYDLLCAACWQAAPRWFEVVTIWDGARWCYAAASIGTGTPPRAGAPVAPPSPLLPDRLIVSNNP